MKLQSLGEGVSLAAVAAQTAVDLHSITPFGDGFNAIAAVHQNAGAGSFVVKVQTSPDNSTWTDAAVVSGVGPAKLVEVTLQRYVRLNVTAAGSAGTCNAYLLG